MTYSISQVSEKLGLPPSTLRYYDKEGLLPGVQRTEGGMRRFTQEDLNWLRLIDCLKQTGMSIRDIREYIRMSAEGDSTIGARLEMFYRQRQQVLEQMRQLQQALDMVNYKCWYYETAQATGTTAGISSTPPQELPPEIRELKARIWGE